MDRLAEVCIVLKGQRISAPSDITGDVIPRHAYIHEALVSPGTSLHRSSPGLSGGGSLAPDGLRNELTSRWRLGVTAERLDSSLLSLVPDALLLSTPSTYSGSRPRPTYTDTGVHISRLPPPPVPPFTIADKTAAEKYKEGLGETPSRRNEQQVTAKQETQPMKVNGKIGISGGRPPSHEMRAPK